MSRQRGQPAAEAFSLVTGSLRFDLTVEGSHWPVVPVSVRLSGHLWGGCRPRLPDVILGVTVPEKPLAA